MGFTFREPPSSQTAPGDFDGRVSVCERVHAHVCLQTKLYPANMQTDGEQRCFLISEICRNNKNVFDFYIREHSNILNVALFIIQCIGCASKAHAFVVCAYSLHIAEVLCDLFGLE